MDRGIEGGIEGGKEGNFLSSCACTHARTHARTHAHTQTHTQTHTHTHAHVHTNTRMRTCTNANMSTPRQHAPTLAHTTCCTAMPVPLAEMEQFLTTMVLPTWALTPHSPLPVTNAPSTCTKPPSLAPSADPALFESFVPVSFGPGRTCVCVCLCVCVCVRARACTRAQVRKGSV